LRCRPRWRLPPVDSGSAAPREIVARCEDRYPGNTEKQMEWLLGFRTFAGGRDSRDSYVGTAAHGKRDRL
jgi:hypothetical protein